MQIVSQQFIQTESSRTTKSLLTIIVCLLTRSFEWIRRKSPYTLVTRKPVWKWVFRNFGPLKVLSATRSPTVNCREGLVSVSL